MAVCKGRDDDINTKYIAPSLQPARVHTQYRSSGPETKQALVII